MTTHQDPAIPALPALSQGLIDLIGRYGLARTDQVSEIERIHLWETLIAGIKDYAGARWLDGYAAGRAAGVQGEAVARVLDVEEHEKVDLGLATWVDWIGGKALSAGTLLYTAPQAETLAAAPFEASMSWNGFNLHGDRKSIQEAGRLLHEAGTVPELKARIAETLAVAEGFVLVPREPTHDMVFATANGQTTVRDIYRAMIQTAPTPTASIAPKAEALTHEEIAAAGLDLGYVHDVLRWAACGYVHTPERIASLHTAYRIVDKLVNAAPKAEGEAELARGEVPSFESWWESWPFQAHKNELTKAAAHHAYRAGKAIGEGLTDCENCLGDGRDGDVDDYGRMVGFDCHQCNGTGKVLRAVPVAQAAVGATWQPIETAPQTGRTVLLGYFNALGKWRTLRGQWFTDAQIQDEWTNSDVHEAGWFETSVECDEEDSGCWPTDPTHWMPLPASPEATAVAPASEALTQQLARAVDASQAGHDPFCMSILRGKECDCGFVPASGLQAVAPVAGEVKS